MSRHKIWRRTSSASSNISPFAKRPTVLQRVKKLSRRHQGVTVTAGIAAGLVLLLVVAFLLYRNSLVANHAR